MLLGLSQRRSQDAFAGGLEVGLPVGVELLGEAAVVPGAVDFEDEALGGPAEVGNVAGALEWLVDVGVLEAGAQDEVEDDVLVGAPRRGGSGCDEGGEPFRCPVAVGSLERLGELADGREVLGLGLANETFEAFVR